MTSSDTATLLDDAAERIADISRADMLRRAALRLHNADGASTDDDVEDGSCGADRRACPKLDYTTR